MTAVRPSSPQSTQEERGADFNSGSDTPMAPAVNIIDSFPTSPNVIDSFPASPNEISTAKSGPSLLSRSSTPGRSVQGSVRRNLSSRGSRRRRPPEGGLGPQATAGSDETLPTVSEWAFPSSEVKIEQGEDGVLGRGSYGEVRIATWRGLRQAVAPSLSPQKVTLSLARVAAKQLHALSGSQAGVLSLEQAAEVRRDLLKEMRLLASLRHPNLLLFLGVTMDGSSGHPLSIITELMPSSVYGLLETRGVRLEQAEVLDLAGDITRGLAYLHGHSPTIVHRDLSSRNVLYDGRTAKLADLGQAKAMGSAVAATGSRQTAMPGAMVYAAPEVLTGRYNTSIDMFSFGVLLAQLITGEYPRLDTRKCQVSRAGERLPLLKSLLERCLCLHAEDRPTAAETARAIESLRLDPCVYRPAGHGAGILADRWFQAEQKELSRGLQARVHVYERRMSAEFERWRSEADRADALAGRIGTAEDERDAANSRRGELEESLDETLGALENERKSHSRTQADFEKEKEHGRSLEAKVERVMEELLRTQRALKSAETLQSLAEGNTTLANRNAKECEKARAQAETRVEQAEAQLAGQVAATREAESRLAQAISRWEGEKVDRLRFAKDFFAKCTEAQHRERTVRDLQKSLQEAVERLSKYDGLPESQQIRRRIIDLEEDCKRSAYETTIKENELEQRNRDTAALAEKVEEVEAERDAVVEQHKATLQEVAQAQQTREEAEKRAERAARGLEKARRQTEEQRKENEKLKEEGLELRKQMKRMKNDAPWLFKAGGGRDRSREGSAAQSSGGNATAGGYEANPSGPYLQSQTGVHDANVLSDSDDDEGVDYDKITEDAQATGPAGVTELMQRHPKRQEVQKRGLRALRDMAYKGNEERAAVAAAGGIAATVRAMERFSSDARIQIGGMKTLAHLAFGNDVNRIEVGSVGGVMTILRGMEAFPSDSDIQGEACTALTNLSHNCDRNRRYVVEGSGLVLILNAMQTFPGEPKLQRQACWVLLTLAANDEISKMIASEGGIGAIIAAMLNNVEDSSVQHFGCWALANVGWGQAGVQKFAREEGAMEAIKAAVHRFPSHEALVAKARLASDVILKGVGLEPL